MLRIYNSGQGSNVKDYFNRSLAVDDYYTKDQNIGVWGGKLKDRLGLGDEVKKEEFFALADNLNPVTGERLTARNVANRIAGFDLTFNAPKSVSLAYSMNKDEEILKAFHASVDETMQDIEKAAMTQTRVLGKKTLRETGNMVWGKFIHTTARPEKREGEESPLPDPALHAHCYVFNATYDKKDGQVKALNNYGFKSQAPYYEAMFHSRFTKRLKELGYGIEKRGNYFELAGVTREMVEKFSTRTKKVEEEAKKKGITDAKEKDQLAAKTRKQKGEELPMDHLVKRWFSHLTYKERVILKKLKSFKGDEDSSPRKALEHAISHGFERRSVTNQKRLLAEALRHGYGSFTPKEIIREFEQNEEVLKKKEGLETNVTTKEVLAQERNIINLAKKSRGMFDPINKGFKPQDDFLNKQQRKAVKHAVTSTDGTILIEGGAGTGKTTLFQIVKPEIEDAGKTLFAFAPSSQASRDVMRKEGFTNADTLQSLLASQIKQNQVRGQVIWVDEAGLVSSPDMEKLLQIAHDKRAKVILSGDTRQHNSPQRGDAYRILQEQAGLGKASVREIIRQKVAQYRNVVDLIQHGKVEKAFKLLERNDQIVELADSDKRHEALVKEYLDTIKDRKTALVVAPTHKEGEEVTKSIREGLKKAGKISVEEQSFEQQRNLNLTDAQKKDIRNYEVGQAVQFFQNARSFKAGEKYDVVSIEKGKVMVKGPDEQERELRLDNETERFQVFSLQEIKVSKGDLIRVTNNGWSKDRKHLFNGNVYRVSGFNEDGEIVLQGGSPLRKDFRNLSHAYVSTSHASQGKTTDKVIIAQSSASFKAGSREQFYVSVSRGKQSVKVFTDNKQQLLDSVSGSSTRKSATELIGKEKTKSRSKLSDLVKTAIYQKPRETERSSPSPGRSR